MFATKTNEKNSNDILRSWLSWLQRKTKRKPVIIEVDDSKFGKSILSKKQGATLIVNNINLNYFGETKLKFLKEKVSNLFTRQGLEEVNIWFKIVDSDNDTQQNFEKIIKNNLLVGMCKVNYFNLKNEIKNKIIKNATENMVKIIPKLQDVKNN